MSRQIGPRVGEGRSAEVFAWDDGRVLKLFRPEFPREFAEREAVVTELAAAAAEMAPRFHGTAEVDGRLGIVLERVSGPTLAQLATARPWLIVRCAHLLARLHATMHGRPVPELPPQAEFLVSAMERAGALPEPPRRAALEDLASARPDDSLCHGDFHPDNVLMTSRGPVVIDWLTASRGDPLIDAARTSMLLSMGALLPGTAAWRRCVIGAGREAFHQLYLRRYLRLTGASRADVARWSLLTAAARMGEGIEVEESRLLRRIERELQRRSAAGGRRARA